MSWNADVVSLQAEVFEERKQILGIRIFNEALPVVRLWRPSEYLTDRVPHALPVASWRVTRQACGRAMSSPLSRVDRQLDALGPPPVHRQFGPTPRLGCR